MKIVNFKIENPIILDSSKTSTLIIENPCFFTYTVNELNKQIKGEDGSFLLFKNEKEIKFSSSATIVFDPINLILNDRKIINKLYPLLKNVAFENDNYLLTQEIVSGLENYMLKLFDKVDYSLSFDIELDSIFKLCGIKLQEIYENLVEKIIDYINVLIELKIADLLILVNLKSYINLSDLQELYKHCIYKDFSLLLIENNFREPVSNEERVLIIDNDLCEILVNYP